MATQSIFHNIIIQDSKTAEAFVNALENAAAADYVFSMLMGEDVGPRREFIEKNATYANIDA